MSMFPFIREGFNRDSDKEITVNERGEQIKCNKRGGWNQTCSAPHQKD